MRVMERNKQALWYANLTGMADIYVLDDQGHKIVDYVDEETHTTYYQVTGEKKPTYTDPVKFDANISFSGGETIAQDFGVDNSSYDASLVYLLNKFPITETSLIWYETTPTFIGEGQDRVVNYDSADYKVVKVKPSLNYTKVLISKRVK